LWISSLTLLRTRFLLFPVAGIGFAPLPDALNGFVAPEVFSTERSALPAALTGHLAGLATGGCRTVTLVVRVAGIGKKEGPATKAFASAWLATHHRTSRKKTDRKSNQKNPSEEDPSRRRKKSFQPEQPKKNQSEEDGIPKRRFSFAINSPLTFWIEQTGP